MWFIGYRSDLNLRIWNYYFDQIIAVVLCIELLYTKMFTFILMIYMNIHTCMYPYMHVNIIYGWNSNIFCLSRDESYIYLSILQKFPFLFSILFHFYPWKFLVFYNIIYWAIYLLWYNSSYFDYNNIENKILVYIYFTGVFWILWSQSKKENWLWTYRSVRHMVDIPIALTVSVALLTLSPHSTFIRNFFLDICLI